MSSLRVHKSDLERRIVVVRDSSHARQAAETWLEQAQRYGDVGWFGPVVPERFPGALPAQAPHWLGRELAAAVFMAGIEPAADALAIVAGLVRGGGVLLLLVATPSDTPFGQRWQRFLDAQRAGGHAETDAWPLPCRVHDPERVQLSAAQRAIYGRGLDLPVSLTGNCILLTAPRGRGKSTLLGAWVRHWLETGIDTIRITAPNPGAIQTLLREIDVGSVRPIPAAGLYRAPERILESPPPQILVVDEAAAFPVHQLLALARHASHTVFATTTTGFEGSGKGFLLRFLAGLRERGVRPRHYRLHRPLRWGPDDPVEAWVNRLFLLEAEAARGRGRIAGSERLGAPVQWRSGAFLARHESDLEDVVGLLSDAHYRTRPSDLQRWLDDPNLAVGLLRGPGRTLLGVVTALVEPGLSEPEARSVWVGARRPQGRFLPCVLASHGAFPLAALSALRVTRIAVHPGWQRRGLGQRLLRAVEAHARRQGCDVLGASFGVTPELLRFWQQGGFDLVRIGFKRETTSGLHAAVVCKGLGPTARKALDRLRRDVAGDWPVWQEGALSALEPATAASVSRGLPAADLVPPSGDADSVRAFAHGRRSLELALPALRRWQEAGWLPAGPLSRTERLLLEAAILQALDWPRLCSISGESGRRGVVRRLRHIVARSLAGASGRDRLREP
jgi:tRNA(Met) cytidine acetyltransferase